MSGDLLDIFDVSAASDESEASIKMNTAMEDEIKMNTEDIKMNTVEEMQNKVNSLKDELAKREALVTTLTVSERREAES